MRALIDGDIVMYKCGFAAQSKDKDEIDPLNYCLASVKSMILNTVDKSGASDYAVYISPSDHSNFRYAVATQKPYKGNRTGDRPVYYDDIRTYLLKHQDAVEAVGCEADDYMGMNQTDDTIICSIDKDMLMIPGKHYNFNKQTVTVVEELEALKTFYKQILTGDSADNIPGLNGIGPVKAGQIINELRTEEEMLEAVFNTYKERLGLTDGEIWAIIEENGKLLWIWRKQDDIWRLPKTAKQPSGDGSDSTAESAHTS